jgi:hypothetical protein
MEAKQRILFALGAVILVAWPGAAQVNERPQYRAGSGGTKARAMLNEAIEAGKKWEPDAMLTSISTFSADMQGGASNWFYGFYSSKKNSYLNVTARGFSLDQLQAATGKKEAVPTDFLDSDQVMTAAVKLGIKGTSPTMGLSGNTWIVMGGTETGNTGVFLDAKTGKLIKRQVVQ